MDFEKVVSVVTSWVTSAGIKIVITLVILAVSFPLINRVTRLIKKYCISRNVDKTVGKTFRYIFNIGTKVLVLCCLLGYLGIDTASISALVATLGLGVGLAVQGSLSNFAGGIIILLTRPFKVDDFIEAQGLSGTVEKIHIIYTYLRTIDNKVIAIPNGTLANGVMVNYNAMPSRRVDLDFTIAYEEDFHRAQQVILDICREHSLVLEDPAPLCRVSEHGASAVTLVTQVWCNSSDYWTVRFDLLEQVKERFDQEHISIPYNQLDVHLDQVTVSSNK